MALGSVEAVKQAVIASLGVAILPEMSVAAEISAGRLRLIKVDGLPLHRTLYRIYRNQPQSKAAVAFNCLLKHAVRGTLPKLKNVVR